MTAFVAVAAVPCRTPPAASAALTCSAWPARTTALFSARSLGCVPLSAAVARRSSLSAVPAMTATDVAAPSAAGAGVAPAVAPARRCLAFRKYQGLGNDFILVDNRDSAELPLSPAEAVALCDRHTGIGGDGIIFLLPPNAATGAAGDACTASMRIINSDGSEPEMCGNGVRCLAVFAADLGMDTATLVLDTLAGVIVPTVAPGGGAVRVDMGVPVTDPPAVPTTLPETTAPVTVDGKAWTMTGVSMGNPHAVTFVSPEDFDAIDKDLERLGPQFENLSSVFPARVNTEFVTVDAPDAVRMVVWERGAGRTRACGTGACAVVVAAVLTGRTERTVTVGLPGGDLLIEWNEADGRVYMTGPAELAFTGSVMV